MLEVIIITILAYSIVTFVVSNIFNSEEVDRILAWGVVGNFVWLISYPLRQYTKNGFYICNFYKDGKIVDVVYTRGGEKPYQKLLKRYPKNEFGCTSHRTSLYSYLKNRNKNRS